MRFEANPVNIALLGQRLDLAEIANHLADHVICQWIYPFKVKLMQKLVLKERIPTPVPIGFKQAAVQQVLKHVLHLS